MCEGLETPRDEVLGDVWQERERQEKKWGVQNHSPLKWYSILGEEFGEVGEAINQLVFAGVTPERVAHYELELIQVAAVAVAAVESLRRNGVVCGLEEELGRFQAENEALRRMVAAMQERLDDIEQQALERSLFS